MTLEPPLFPERVWVDPARRRDAEETPLGGTAARYLPLRRGTLFALAYWVGGGTFHRYGVRPYDLLAEAYGVEEALRELREHHPELKVEGHLDLAGYSSEMRWSVWYRRAGGLDAEYGGCSGYSTPEDAAYACLTAIEQDEREAYEERLVVGTA